jgi:hypothetical protein
MKTPYYVILAAFALCTVATVNVQNPTTFDVERAIRNQRTFDLTELATGIEYIPLDDSQKEGLLSGIMAIAESKTGFYVAEERNGAPVKLFDRKGRFVATRGSTGRGPGEYLGVRDLTVDYDTDRLYIAGSGVADPPVLAYDPAGKVVANKLMEMAVSGIVFQDDRVIVLLRSPQNPMNPDVRSSIGTEVPLLEIYSPGLEHEKTVKIVDKGSGHVIKREGDLLSGNLRINLWSSSHNFLMYNGEAVTVKDERGNVVYRYRDGGVENAYKLDYGRYTFPDNLYGTHAMERDLGDYYQIQRAFEGERYIFVPSTKIRDESTVQIVLDKTAPSGGFTALGPEGKPGLFVGGIAFTPMYIRDNRLVGYMQALDMIDNAASITNPKLKALAVTLKEDSNPVIVIATLKP